MIENQETEVRLSKAILEMRSEKAPVEPRARLIDAMTRKPRSAYPVRWVVAGATAGLCVAVVLLWPQQRALAWSQVVAATRATRKFHAQFFSLAPNGSTWMKVGDLWIDGNKSDNEIVRLANGRVPAWKMILRRDGKRFFRSPIGFGGPSNEGVVSKLRSNWASIDESKMFSIDSILNSKYLTIDGPPEHVQLDGKDVLRYRGTEKGRPPGHPVFYADPNTGIMLRQESHDESGRMTAYMTIELPKSIPASMFEPPAGMKIINEDVERAKLENIMSHGIPFGAGNVLRAVIGGGKKFVTLEWTGEHPNADGLPHAHIEGYRALRVSTALNFGLLSDGRAAGTPKYKGQPLYWLQYELDKPVGKFVTLDVPILVPDHARPIIDRKGMLVGYWPKRVGTKRLVHVPVHDVWNVGGDL